MPARRLPAHANLDHLRYQAKDLLREHRARRPEAAQRLREFHPLFSGAADGEIFRATLSPGEAQMVVAREHGFASWARLKRHIERTTIADQLDRPHHERIEDGGFRDAVELLDAGDARGLEELLRRRPALVHQHVTFEGGNYFRSPTLLEFVAENPVRRARLPAQIVEVARVILEAGPSVAARNEALMLTATGRVARECKVQLALIDLLCDFGADPNSALRAAAVLNEHEAALALLRRGAKLDLAVAAALGREREFAELLADAAPEERHLALALAAQFGRAAMVGRLLDGGEDPDRYDPPGGHSHATPLHQAAGAGHEAVVRLLVERGARPDQRDVLWRGTPADWAAHEGHAAVAQYLRALERGEG